MGKVLCFTGRRPKDMGFTEVAVSSAGREYLVNAQNEKSYEPFLDRLTEIVEIFYKKGYDTFVTGGAQGFDQVAFRAVARVKEKYSDIKNIFYAPFRGQERQWASFGYFGQDEYRRLLQQADEVIYVVDDELVEYKDIVKALYARNHAMVDISDKCLAMYSDNDWQTHKGGTCECMRYAFSKKVPIVQIEYHTDNDILYLDKLRSALPQKENINDNENNRENNLYYSKDDDNILNNEEEKSEEEPYYFRRWL